jgi:hypothetical protein
MKMHLRLWFHLFSEKIFQENAGVSSRNACLAPAKYYERILREVMGLICIDKNDCYIHVRTQVPSLFSIEEPVWM